MWFTSARSVFSTIPSWNWSSRCLAWECYEFMKWKSWETLDKISTKIISDEWKAEVEQCCGASAKVFTQFWLTNPSSRRVIDFVPIPFPPVDHFSLPFNNFLPIDWEFNRSRKLYNFELKFYVSFGALMRFFLSPATTQGTFLIGTDLWATGRLRKGLLRHKVCGQFEATGKRVCRPIDPRLTS